jgi:hypothetical protein
LQSKLTRNSYCIQFLPSLNANLLPLCSLQFSLPFHRLRSQLPWRSPSTRPPPPPSSRPPFRYHTLSTRLPFPPASSHSHSSAAHRRRLRLLAIYSCFTCSRSLFQEVRLTSRPPKPATFSLRRPHLAARAAAGNAPTSPVRGSARGRPTPPPPPPPPAAPTRVLSCGFS